jgi:hypothetical protein
MSHAARLVNLALCCRLSTAMISFTPRRLRPATSREPMNPAAPVTT